VLSRGDEIYLQLFWREDVRGACAMLVVWQLAAVALSLTAVNFGAWGQGAPGTRSDSLFRPWAAAPAPTNLPGVLRRHLNQQRRSVSRTADADRESALASRDGTALPEHLQRVVVRYPTEELPGTLIVDTSSTYLYLILGRDEAMRYGIGVGREGFKWAGRERITHKAHWPDWHAPAEMLQRDPDLPRFISGGPNNPLGARALYLGNTLYRIHGTNEPTTIGNYATSGCIRLQNQDVIDLYERVKVGAEVVVLSMN
jgi:lipoprotein-anchoring transpeptidase ErfK/SrfK